MEVIGCNFISWGGIKSIELSRMGYGFQYKLRVLLQNFYIELDYLSKNQSNDMSFLLQFFFYCKICLILGSGYNSNCYFMDNQGEYYTLFVNYYEFLENCRVS